MCVCHNCRAYIITVAFKHLLILVLPSPKYTLKRLYCRYTPSIDSGLSSSRRTSFSSSDKNSVYGAADSPTTVDSLCNSPLSAGSAPKNSPAAPHGAASDPSTPPGSAKMHARCSPFSASNIDPQLLMQQKSALKRPAKERLRALINNEDMDEAWAWTCKFIQVRTFLNL